jgi:hypothetical protein
LDLNFESFYGVSALTVKFQVFIVLAHGTAGYVGPIPQPAQVPINFVRVLLPVLMIHVSMHVTIDTLTFGFSNFFIEIFQQNMVTKIARVMVFGLNILYQIKPGLITQLV